MEKQQETQAQPVAQPQAAAAPVVETPEETINKLCIWSIVCRAGAPLFLIISIVISMAIGDEKAGILGSIISSGAAFVTMSYPGLLIASWVLAIMAKVKAPKAKLPTILLIVYGVLVALKIIGTIIALVFVFSYMIECLESLGG